MYQLLLHKQQQYVHRFTGFLLFAHLLVAGFMLKHAETPFLKYFAPVSVALFVLLLLLFFFLPSNRESRLVISFHTLILVLFWGLQLAWLPGLIVLAITIFAWKLHRTPDWAIISESGIQIRTAFTQKSYSWQECSNLVLKDRLLSIDFTNNKLLQIPLSPNAPELDEAQFNAFCLQQIPVANQMS